MTRRTAAAAAAAAATATMSPARSKFTSSRSSKPTETPTRKRTRSSSTSATVTPVKIEPIDSLPPTPQSGTGAPAKRSKTLRSNGATKKEEQQQQQLDATPPPSSSDVKKEEQDEGPATPASSPRKQSTSERKLASYKAAIQGSPFPDHPLPTAEEAERVAWILGERHGYKRESEGGRGLPQYTTPKGEDKFGGCGDVASVMDALVRTVLSCNTSGRNSAAAHRSLTERFGKHNWQAILDADESEVVDALRCGGLANNKTKTIRGILRETQERHGVLSLDHLHHATDDEIMQELVSFNGVGPKVASCVLAFCIGRQSMAVDTHVFRLCKALGWVPEKANRDQTYYHLHERVPGHLKYPLHVLLIKHGKTCDNCSAKGFATVKEEAPSEDEEELDADQGKGKPCPLKAAGLIGRKGKALRAGKAEEPDTKPSVKSEGKGEAKNASNAPAPDSPSRRRVKPAAAAAAVKEENQEETTRQAGSSTASREALQRAQAMSSEDLLKCIQKIQGTRSKNPLSETLKKKRYTLELSHGSDLSTEQRKRVFSIFEANMKAMYRNSSLGWKPAEKRRELFDAASRFLIVRPPDVGAEIAGYVMWRFDTELCHPSDPLYPRAHGAAAKPDGEETEEELEIAYLYEIQVDAAHQRDGLGREMLRLLFSLTRQLALHKVMLTVFKANTNAFGFYRAEGYAVDAVSPSKGRDDDEVDYEILSKPTVG